MYQAIALNTIKISTAFIIPSAGALIIVNTAGKLLNSGLLILGLQQNKRINSALKEEKEDRASLLETAKLYRDFPLLRAPQTFINTASYTLPIIMLAAFFGPTAVGYYALANSVLGMPVGLLGASVMQVFYPRANEAHQNGEHLDKLIIETTIAMAIVGIAPFLLIILFGPEIFEFVFGPGWGAAGIYAQWLSAWLFFGYVSRPTVAAIPVLVIQKGFLTYEVFSTSIKFISIFFGYYIFNSEVAAIALFSISGAISYLYLITWVVFSARTRHVQREITTKETSNPLRQSQ